MARWIGFSEHLKLLKRGGVFMRRDKNGFFSHFLNVSGPFLGDSVAWDEVRAMTRNQRQKLIRHGIIPVPVFRYLARTAIIAHSDLPACGMNVETFLHFLFSYRYRSEQARTFGRYVFEEVLKAEVPIIRKSFAQVDGIWTKIEEQGTLFGINRKSGMAS
jgi:hypothetical protein